MDSKELNRIYGERLCLARKMRGLSMDELVAKMGDKAVTKQAISKYEQGKMMPVPEVRKALAKTLGLPEGWFFGTAIAVKIDFSKSRCTMTAEDLVKDRW